MKNFPKFHPCHHTTRLLTPWCSWFQDLYERTLNTLLLFLLLGNSPDCSPRPPNMVIFYKNYCLFWAMYILHENSWNYFELRYICIIFEHEAPVSPHSTKFPIIRLTYFHISKCSTATFWFVILKCNFPLANGIINYFELIIQLNFFVSFYDLLCECSWSETELAWLIKKYLIMKMKMSVKIRIEIIRWLLHRKIYSIFFPRSLFIIHCSHGMVFNLVIMFFYGRCRFCWWWQLAIHCVSRNPNNLN